MARKRKLDNLRHRLMPLYTFDKTEQESDWETEFLNSVENPNYTVTRFLTFHLRLKLKLCLSELNVFIKWF